MNVYVRGGARSRARCADGHRPRSPITGSSQRLPDTTAATILAGCGGPTTVDTIGVQITYDYDWKTPLPHAPADGRDRATR